MRPLYAVPAVPVEEQAIEWFARLRSDERTLELELEFERWMAASPTHEREYRKVEQLWCDLTPQGGSDEIQEMRRQAIADAQGNARQLRRQRGLRALRAMAASIGCIGLVGLLVVNQFPLQKARYQTEAGDRHTVTLADGSQITLNTDTVVRVDYGWRTRTVVLERGQAHFKVAHAVLRPFEVDAGKGVVRALGTAFDVHREGEDVRVTLVEGKVEVASLLPVTDAGDTGVAKNKIAAVLNPGQEVTISARGVSSVRETSVPRATAWLSGRLLFDNERLQDAVSEVNRYSPVKLVVRDRALANMRISGVFRAGRAETFVDALRASYPIEVVTAADSTLILEPAAARLSQTGESRMLR